MLVKRKPPISSMCQRISTLSTEIDRGNFTSDPKLFLESCTTAIGIIAYMMYLYYRTRQNMLHEFALECVGDGMDATTDEFLKLYEAEEKPNNEPH